MSRFLSPAIEENLPAIILRPHGEVNPVGSATLLEDQLVKVTLSQTLGDGSFLFDSKFALMVKQKRTVPECLRVFDYLR